MSADCCCARPLMRSLTDVRSTATSPATVPTPTRGASRNAVTRSLVAMRVLLGTQSVSTHDPPMPSRSTTVTVAPSCAATSADSYPAGPPPTITMRVTCPFSRLVPSRLHRYLGSLPSMSTTGGLYAAYGSNMDPAQMLERCPHSPAAGTGWLNGWRLTFGGEELGWDGALAMVVPDADSQVFVALYEMSPQDHQ